MPCAQAEDSGLVSPLQSPNWVKVCLISTVVFLPVSIVPRVEKCLGLFVGDRILCLRSLTADFCKPGPVFESASLVGMGGQTFQVDLSVFVMSLCLAVFFSSVCLLLSLSLPLSLSVFLCLSLSLCVLPRWPSGKASASRAEDPGFESRLCRDFFGVKSYQ